MSNIEHFGYYAVFLLCVVESLCIPAVGEVVLGFTGFLVYTNTLEFLPAVLAAWSGSMLGSLIIYFIFRRGGRPLVYRYGHYIRITPKRFDRFSEWFYRFGPLLIVPWRQIPIVRTKISIVAGIFDLGLPVFSVLTGLGIAIWTIGVIYFSMSLGNNWQFLMQLAKDLGNYVYFITLLGLLGIAIIWFWRRSEKRRKRHAYKSNSSRRS